MSVLRSSDRERELERERKRKKEIDGVGGEIKLSLRKRSRMLETFFNNIIIILDC